MSSVHKCRSSACVLSAQAPAFPEVLPPCQKQAQVPLEGCSEGLRRCQGGCDIDVLWWGLGWRGLEGCDDKSQITKFPRKSSKMVARGPVLLIKWGTKEPRGHFVIGREGVGGWGVGLGSRQRRCLTASAALPHRHDWVPTFGCLFSQPPRLLTIPKPRQGAGEREIPPCGRERGGTPPLYLHLSKVSVSPPYLKAPQVVAVSPCALVLATRVPDPGDSKGETRRSPTFW